MTGSTVGSKIDARKKAKLIEKADENGKNVNQVLKGLIDGYLDGRLGSEEKAKLETVELGEFAPILTELREFRKRFLEYWEDELKYEEKLRNSISEIKKKVEALEEGEKTPDLLLIDGLELVSEEKRKGAKEAGAVYTDKEGELYDKNKEPLSD